MKKILLEKIKNIYEIYHNKNFKNIFNDLKNKIYSYQILTFVEIEEILKKAMINFNKINSINNLKLNKIYLCLIANNKNYNLGFLKLKKNFVYIYIKNKPIIKINKNNLKEFEFIKIWEINGIFENENLKIFTGINNLKIKYASIFVFYELIIITLVLIGNLYLKFMIDYVIPNQDNDLLIKISIFFLIIFLINLIIEQMLFFIRKKIINQNVRKYYLQMVEYFNWLSHEENKKIDFNSFQNFSNSITVMIEHYIFLVPNLIASIVNILIIILIFFFLNWYFVLISFILIIGIFIFNVLKLKANSYLIKKQIHFKNNIEKWLNQFYFFTLEEKNNYIYEKYKNKIAINTERFEKLDNQITIRFKKIEILENFFKKLLVVALTTLFTWTIIQNWSLLGVSTLLYMMILINNLINSTEEIFGIFTKFPEYKFYKPFFTKILNFHMIREENKIIIDSKINEIRFLKPFFLRKKQKCNLLLRNDTLIYGKSGIGKTTFVKTLLSPKNNHQIYLNKILKKHFKNQWLKENIIYYNSKFNETILKPENILFSNLDHSKIIINLIKKYQINISQLDNLSSGQKQFIKFLSLLNYKNKIIILDEPFSNIDSNFKKEIMLHFKKILVENNFIIWISHDLNIRKYFKYKLEIK